MIMNTPLKYRDIKKESRFTINVKQEQGWMCTTVAGGYYERCYVRQRLFWYSMTVMLLFYNRWRFVVKLCVFATI
jgi:hypothetical protein